MHVPDEYQCDITDTIASTPTAVSSLYNVAAVSGDVRGLDGPPSHGVSMKTETQLAHPPLDIEHVFVKDDPREWSRKRKTFTLAIVASAALIATLGINIYSPLWSECTVYPASAPLRTLELGRIYQDKMLNEDTHILPFSAAINIVRTQLHATDQEISLSLSIFILVQGTIPLLWSAISEIRGRKFVYLTSTTLYVVGCAVGGSSQNIGVLLAMRILQAIGAGSLQTIGTATLADIYEPCERGTVVGIYYVAPLLGPSLGPTVGGVLTQFLNWRATFYSVSILGGLSLLSFIFLRDTFRRERSLAYQTAMRRRIRDTQIRTAENVGAEEICTGADPTPDLETTALPQTIAAVHLSMGDINPIVPLAAILRQRNNIAILFPSAMVFGLSYSIAYTVALTFAAEPYHYGALNIGLVLLCFGTGSMAGSILGGRWSDRMLVRLKASNGGRSNPEDRLQSTKPMMIVLPLSLIAYAWAAEKKTHISVLCVLLVIAGFSSVWMYSSTLAYIVDANVGRSSTAAATNSFVRAFAGCVAAELAVPLRNTMGDGGLYTLWAGVMAMSAGILLLTMARGAQWREMGRTEKTREGEKMERG